MDYFYRFNNSNDVCGEESYCSETPRELAERVILRHLKAGSKIFNSRGWATEEDWTIVVSIEELYVKNPKKYSFVANLNFSLDFFE